MMPTDAGQRAGTDGIGLRPEDVAYHSRACIECFTDLS
jgi:hypothetical protein